MNITDYPLPSSPYQGRIRELIESVVQQYGRQADDALYLVVQKRWINRVYEGDDNRYVAGLVSDASKAKREFEECFYADDITQSVLSTLKFGAASLAIVLSDEQCETELASEVVKDYSHPKHLFASLLCRHPVFAMLTYLLLPVAGVAGASTAAFFFVLLVSSVLVSYYISSIAALLRQLHRRDVWYWHTALYALHGGFITVTMGMLYFFSASRFHQQSAMYVQRTYQSYHYTSSL